MFCLKCGKALRDDSKFCPYCGAAMKENLSENQNSLATGASGGEENAGRTEAVGKAMNPGNDGTVHITPARVMEATVLLNSNPAGAGETQQTGPVRKHPKRSSIIAAIIAAVILTAAVSAVIYSRMPAQRLKYQLSLGEQYLAELNYEQAAACFTEAVRIDPQASDAHIGLGHAYEAMGWATAEAPDGGDETEAGKYLQLALEEYRTAMELAEDTTDIGMLAERIVSVEDVLLYNADREENEELGNAEAEKEEVLVSKEREAVDLLIRQVDNSDFPKITFYANVTDADGKTVGDLDMTDFTVQEIQSDKSVHPVSIDRVYQILTTDHVNIDLVMDISDSMNNSGRITKAQNAARTFLSLVSRGDQVEMISFNSYVYLEQSFTDDLASVKNAVTSLDADGMTALYDALYAAIYDTYGQDGAKCVIAFTDGIENASSHTFDEVAELSISTGIPVFIIGFGEAYESEDLNRLAQQCSGEYYSIEEMELQEVMESIYAQIYREQKDYYAFDYVSADTGNQTDLRTIRLSMSEKSDYDGAYAKTFVPVADISGGFSMNYANVDYILPFSSDRAVTAADLRGLSLAELRIARNEVYARHGRQFRDRMLNNWFYSKRWYLSIQKKYSPGEFDKISPNPLSRQEQDNVKLILAYEKNIMETSMIYPDAASEALSEYDLYLSKNVLKRALEQMRSMKSTTILKENIKRVEDAISAPEVEY